MSFKSNLKLDAKLFDQSERQKAFSAAPFESAQEFRADLKQKMEDSIPSGREVSIGEGFGFSTRFRRSRRGQRPAIQTRKLISSILSYRRGTNSAETAVTAEDEHGRNIGERLQNQLDRKVMTPEDVAQAEATYNKKLQQKLIGLL